MSNPRFRALSAPFGPSPIHRLERLTQHLGGARIWAKREDCNSGLAFGGNKTRCDAYVDLRANAHRVPALRSRLAKMRGTG